MAKPREDKMEGVEMASAEHAASHPLLTEDEKRVLELYDRLEALQLEMAVLKAHGILSEDPPQEASELDIQEARDQFLEAKASYSSRSNIIDSVLIANPISNAVHAGPNASIVEVDLLPLIEQRDQLSVAFAELTSKVRSAREELTETESEHILLARENVQLAATMMSLADEAKKQNRDVIVDPKSRTQLDELDQGVRDSRQKWRIMKGTTSAIIAGSGVDWARDPKLLEIVLDADNENDEDK
ncbi:hypothetical protein BP5796_08089 [Coleophoma crateriformis]|uniref:Centromere protein H C-terminal domain-containing protein n=1 Tax=Coleophoma crateriformis TaxID=565419 RepID=A0A3D8RDE4_9HELO|nr:hypothetical protein BP5796_08089 [Coleophoma crateriformis]